jgi:acetyl-CoA C-acetyltransferase
VIPVIVGVGQVNDRESGLDSQRLMEVALREADADAGGGWLARLDSLAVVDQISFPALGNVSRALAAALGATPRLCTQTPYPTGDGPILLLNEAANRIAAGEIDVAAVVGGEALRTAARMATAGAAEATRALSESRAPAFRQRYGLVAPVDIYPLYENAGRAAYGQSLEEGQQETGEIWSRFSDVAATNDGAWLRKPVSAQAIRAISADNRPIAFPYTKLMVANSSVNQGAGFIVTSLERAHARGIPEHRLIHVGRGAAAHEPEDVLARDGFARSASLEACLRHTLLLNGLTTEDLDLVELYSCFPCVPKMARRILGWPVDRPASVVGGLTFGGGPIGNYMSHAVVSMVRALRSGGRYGLLFANGGFATSNHAIILGRTPTASLPHPFDVQADADRLRGPIPTFIEDYTGPGQIETYTVFYTRDGSVRFGLIVGLTPQGARFLAKVPAADTECITFLTNGDTEPVASTGDAFADGPDIIWRGPRKH